MLENIDFKSLNDAAQKEVVRGDTTFVIKKLLIEPRLECLEHVRYALVKSEKTLDLNLSTLGDGENQEALGIVSKIVSTFLSLHPDDVKKLQNMLFAEVKFKNSLAQTPRTLAGDIPMAFHALEPTHVYEIMIRAFIVNFLGSFTAASSLMDSLLPKDE